MNPPDVSTHPLAAPSEGPMPPGAPAPSGAAGWWSFFLIYIPVPFVGAILWVVMAARTRNQLRGQQSPAAATSRNALNWAITYLIGLTVIFVLVFALAILAGVLTETGALDEGTASLPLLLPFLGALLWTALAWFHAIAGGIAAGKGRSHKAWIVVPFVKE